jgi:hypothetical protein
MKKFLVVVFFCLPACGQAAYSGHGLYSGRAAYGASVCGPGNAYSCFVSNTNVINYATPIPSWGPNTCDSTNMTTLSQCGNLTGVGTQNTPADFGNTIVRVTDVNTNGNPNTIWQTYDQPSINAWNIDDTGMILKVNGGSLFIFNFNPSTLTSSIVTPNLSFSGAAVWSHTQNNHVFSLNGTALSDNTVNLGAGSMSTSTLFDYNQSTCLTNSVNGYTGGSFPQNEWNGDLTSSQDDSTFAMAFSLLPTQGSGYYQAVWTVGQAGCDLYNTLTGVVTHNGTLLGTIPDTQWGGAFGGKADRFKIHDGLTSSSTYVSVGATASNFVYGSYSVGDYIWQKGTTNVVHCGIGAPDWKANSAYNDGDRVQPKTAVNAGNWIYQIITPANAGTSAASAPTWDQTPGHDVTENVGTTNVPIWRNVGIGTAQEYPCDGHGWKGYLGVAVGKNITYHSYVDPSVPLLQTAPVGISSAGDQHLGSTNGNLTDTNWEWIISTDYGTTTDLLHGTLPSPLYMEGFFISPPYKSAGSLNCVYDAVLCPTGTLGQVRRAFHAFNSGWHQSFDVQNNIAVISQTGKFAMFSTDGMGQFGNKSGQPKCNVGGPKWNATDSTDYPVGTVIYPILSNDAGAYLYTVQSCSASPCTTGTTQPNWSAHQSSTVAGMGTFVDGNITWAGAPDVYTPTNTAVQNCRADVMVVKLTR